MTPTPPRFVRPLLALAVLCPVALPSAYAIQPQRWTHSTEADFEAGELDGVVVTNLGDIKLATAVDSLGEFPEEVTVIYDMAVVGETTFIAAGPAGKLLKLVDGEITELADLPDHQVFALLASSEGFVTAALSGQESKLVAYDAEGEVLREMLLPEDVRYIWDMATRNDGEQLVLATGPEGKVLGVNADGETVELLDTAQANVLCLAEGANGAIFAGTDTDGLVYRLDAEGVAFVAYDADEPEIGALLVAEDGSVYVGTADAEQATPGRMEDPTEEETGRPEPEGDAEAAPPAELPGDPEPQPLDTAEGAEAAEGVAEETEAGAEAATEEAAAEDAAAEDSAEETEIAEAGPPSPEQLDALREEVRKRLLAARKSGKVAAGPASGKSAARPTRNARPASTGGDKSGNAVYRIDTQGFVSEVFRESVAVLDLVEQADGHILVGTGSEGQLYRLDPAAGETSVLNDLEAQQLLTLVVADGRILVGGSNPAALIELTDETAGEGSYTSDVLDATHISLWGTFLVTAQGMGDNGTVQVETRSGNVSDPEIAAWSEWSVAESVTAQVADPLQPREYTIGSPPARFLQYRLTLQGGDTAEAGGPTVGKVELAYVTPNLRPSVSSFTAAYPDFAGVDQPASPAMSIGWEATDENGDRLLYDLEFKPAAATKNGWLPLVEDLADASYEWDTRKVPDGRYHLRVTADDRLDNPGDMAMQARRLADPVLIDNTPPAAGELKVEVTGTTAKVSATAKDAYSPIQSVAYTLDDAKEYTPVLPDDLIYDSTSEAWSATLSDLSPGGHSLTVRTLDARGNATYTSTLFEVK
ncbi:Ig-like domain-containing protein [Algisphaera agarilytica]|uniref:Outer membrane protein assembly factor BamB n=1 Tax=Algisphaera agarilytica TaxID=1385975 RepID=A0A7X0LM59_9BACT|nr:Ig-like domain-containing protein [Algisphaera agarilytica]MBB6431624.1 outer membrane protein assembly factor BamB [Algisphaera agarilytica]